MSTPMTARPGVREAREVGATRGRVAADVVRERQAEEVVRRACRRRRALRSTRARGPRPRRAVSSQADASKGAPAAVTVPAWVPAEAGVTHGCVVSEQSRPARQSSTSRHEPPTSFAWPCTPASPRRRPARGHRCRAGTGTGRRARARCARTRRRGRTSSCRCSARPGLRSPRGGSRCARSNRAPRAQSIVSTHRPSSGDVAGGAAVCVAAAQCSPERQSKSLLHDEPSAPRTPPSSIVAVRRTRGEQGADEEREQGAHAGGVVAPKRAASV